ncbi:MAG: endopeptidase La [Eubacteriales bacterium]|uniref:endopeptidase La n=1 Tax=Fenollaria sp. TaxID=1965292 RepID=UPI002A74ECDE|nr:endopeptidase La [Fenollaria sp.]MDD7339247.1 endopeptidase La [Eubacteriales bacterium]MDY3106243.1 endopeptidase La [Fenollaria sp.]
MDNYEEIIDNFSFDDDYGEDGIKVPIVSIQDLNLVSNNFYSINLDNEDLVTSIAKASKTNGIFAVFQLKTNRKSISSAKSVHEIGILAEIESIVPNNKYMKMNFRTLSKVYLTNVFKNDGIVYGDLIKLNDENDYSFDNPENITYSEVVKSALDKLNALIMESQSSKDRIVPSTVDYNMFLDSIFSRLDIDKKITQDYNNALDKKERTKIVIDTINKSIVTIEVLQTLQDKTKDAMDKNQRDYILHEQLKIIKNELNADKSGAKNIFDAYRSDIKKLKVPKEVEEKAFKEIEKLEQTPVTSPDYPSTLQYIELIKDLPWNTRTKDTKDLKLAKEILDRDHYGLKDVKDRILEYLAILNNKKAIKGSIICFVGPPGVGKTSIANSIANATNRNFVRMSLGGIKDEADIRGHMRTYVGSMPGRIISLMKKAKSKNPVFLFDEIDKIGQDFRGDPSSALLEVLDSSQNSDFTDRYLELPYDLSEVLFITTANSLDTIPEALLDRLEIIRIEGYTDEEKLNIAKKYLVPKSLENAGLSKDAIKFDDEALYRLIDNYTRESGVRELERKIQSIIRKLVYKKYMDDDLVKEVDVKTVDKLLEGPIFEYNLVDKEDSVGKAVGLAWTRVGGDTINVEAQLMPGDGKLNITGNLGKVMQESCQLAISYLKANYEYFNIDKKKFKDYDIHVHVPEGAIPKDGPSAGITITTAILSALTDQKINRYFAMTGEITLLGNVLAIGGLKEKALAAKRMKIRDLILPMENKKDFEKLPKNIKESLNVHYVNNFKELSKIIFIDGDKDA